MPIRLVNSGTYKKLFQPISLCMASLAPDLRSPSVSFLNQHVLSVANPVFKSSVVRTQPTVLHDIFMQFLRSITQFNFSAACDLYGINNFYCKNIYLTSMQRKDNNNRVELKSHMKTYPNHRISFESTMLKSTQKTTKNPCLSQNSVYIDREQCISKSVVDLKKRNWSKKLPAGPISISACPEMFSKPSCRYSADCRPTVKTDHNIIYLDEALFSNTLKKNSPEKIPSVFTQSNGGNDNVDTNNNDAIGSMHNSLIHHDSPPQSTTRGSFHRQRNLSECSDESFICFIDDAENTCQLEMDSDIEEDSSDSEIEGSEIEDNECAESDHLPMMQSMNYEYEKTDSRKRADLKKVRFNLKPKVYTMYTWNFAYRSARKGNWEDCARDRARFQQRIQRTAAYLNPVLSPEHRDEIYNSRFNDQTDS